VTEEEAEYCGILICQTRKCVTFTCGDVKG